MDSGDVGSFAVTSQVCTGNSKLPKRDELEAPSRYLEQTRARFLVQRSRASYPGPEEAKSEKRQWDLLHGSELDRSASPVSVGSSVLEDAEGSPSKSAPPGTSEAMQGAHRTMKSSGQQEVVSASSPRFENMGESLRFAFVMPMATGHLNPSLPLARSLIQLGHEVHYLSREAVRAAIEKTGASFTDAAEEQVELYENREQDIMGAFRTVAREHGMEDAPMMVGISTISPIHLELQLPGTIRWLQRLQPHVVLFCPMMNAEAVYAAKTLQIPSVGLWTFAGPGGMVGILNMFLKQSGIPMEEVMARVEAFQPMKDSMARLKENYNVTYDFSKSMSPMGFLSTMCEANFNLITTAEEFQDPFPGELSRAYVEAGAKFEYVGPLLEDDVPELELESEKAMKAVAEARSVGRKVVLASMGTILVSDTDDVGWRDVPRDGSERPRGLTGKQLCQAAWSAVFDAFGATDEASQAPLLIVAVGRQPDALTDIDIPRNALCLPVLPQVPLLKSGVNLFLTHGGQNSFMESLSAGVPVVVCPGFGDQAVNAMKAEAMGVGLQVQRPLPPHGEEMTAIASYRADVSAALVRTLQEPQFAEKARHCKECLRNAGGLCKARELLFGLVGQSFPKLLGHAPPVSPKSAKASDVPCAKSLPAETSAPP
ncbi:ATG26 [Symbiodinium necroappetens]|uniref:ATG26 protein n=1 Tax=Symbiodinium necroappetens TaxID=1628268 RepID=A0A812YX92_9DINO|nr:ATG26 [Symbiodinium necroappetens]